MVNRRTIAVAAALAAGSLAFVLATVIQLGAHEARRAAPAPAAIISAIPTQLPPPTPTPTPTPAPAGLRVKVPEVGIDLPLVEGDGYNAPLYKAAHYPGTSWPGQGGRTVIYAHARVGMFGPLFGARVGEHIEISAPDGSVRRYVITQYFPHWPVTDLSWLRPGDHEEVVLVTCTTYNYNDPRIIVVAEPE
jgi:LPXTG-site transpeptidase (sortase) family protein